MKLVLIWLVVVLIGFGAMLDSYYVLQGPQSAEARRIAAELKASAKAEGVAPLHGKFSAKDLSRVYGPSTRVPFGAFELYLFGQALVLTGGSALFILLYAGLARRLTTGVLGEPMREVANRKWLLIGLHVAFFGVMIMSAHIAYAAPNVQKHLLAQVSGQILGGSGPLGFAFKAYLSRSILLAAAATLAVNFFVGTLLSITLPSIIVPGVGAALVLYRFVIWGFLLAPSYAALSGTMLPHTFTALVEGEASILCAFFAVLIPIYLFRPSKGASAIKRYGRAFLVNAKGQIWVFAILAVAAIYEAIEVIAQMR